MRRDGDSVPEGLTEHPGKGWGRRLVTQKYAQITGWGMYVPPSVIPNDAFVKMGLDTSDDWIISRTGIESRRVVRDESTSDMSVRAAKEALRVAEMNANELDLVLVATTTPDHIMPATASLVQDRLGAANAGAMDLNAACAGFVYALTTGASLIESGRARRVLVVGADELSLHLDWKDRSTCVLFGDGAGAVVLKAADEPGIMGSSMGSDGSGAGLLMIAGQRRRRYTNGGNGVSANGVGAMPSYLTMNGPQIFRWATQMMARAADKVIQSSGLKASDIDLLIPHQANARIMEATAKRLGHVDRQGVLERAGLWQHERGVYSNRHLRRDQVWENPRGRQPRADELRSRPLVGGGRAALGGGGPRPGRALDADPLQPGRPYRRG